MGNLWLVIIFISSLVFIFFLASRDKKKRIIFFGDSITQAGTQPNGYITIIKKIMQRQNITSYKLIAEGVGGNKVDDLYARMDNDVLSRVPNIVVVFVGVNDVWHKQTRGGGTDEVKFEKYYRGLVSKLMANEIKIIVCTLALIGEKKDFENQLDAELERYCNIIRNVAAELRLSIVDLREAFLKYEMQYNINNTESGILTVDGVHLNDKGNELVAEEIWSILKEVK